MPLCREYPILDHIFFCEVFYDSSTGYLKQVNIFIIISYLDFISYDQFFVS